LLVYASGNPVAAKSLNNGGQAGADPGRFIFMKSRKFKRLKWCLPVLKAGSSVSLALRHLPPGEPSQADESRNLSNGNRRRIPVGARVATERRPRQRPDLI
jgi:hypothetical protein